MANYSIIGGDDKEYGPVTDTDVRQWLAEGRLNAQSRAKGEGDAEFRTLATFPEFADAFATDANPATIAPLKSSASGSFSQGDYELDLGGCITRGWELVKNNFWPAIGISALVFLASIGINQVFGLLSSGPMNEMIRNQQVSARGILIVLGVTVLGAPFGTILMAGLFKYFLKLLRNESAGIGDAFSGFGPHTGQLILLSLVQMVLVILGYCLCIIPGIYLSVAWYFAIPLVIDRGMNFWEAMELSRKMVNKHWFMVFACMLVFGLIGVAGIIACGIGILFTLPIGIAALMYAYETIFGNEKN